MPLPDCPNHLNLSTIWKEVVARAGTPAPAKERPGSEPVLELHIENTRLFKIAAGHIKPQEWERLHLQRCEVCKGVLHVFINQLERLSDPDKKQGEAA